MLSRNRYDQVLDLAVELVAMSPAEIDYGWIAELLPPGREKTRSSPLCPRRPGEVSRIRRE